MKTLRGITNKDARKVVRAAIKAGCTWSITHSNHVRLGCPNGSTVMVALTTGDRHSYKNLRAQLRREGVPL